MTHQSQDAKSIINKIELLMLESEKLDNQIEKKMEKIKPILSERDEKLSEINSLRSELTQIMRDTDEKNVETTLHKVSRRDTTKVQILDDNAVIEWIKKTPNVRKSDYVVVKEQLNKTPFKSYAKVELMKGKEIDGVKLEESSTVSFKKK